MTPTERNQFYKTFMMINTSLELIIKRAKEIREDSLDQHIYTTEFKSNCHNNANDIINMAESIERRKKPALTMIEEQRKAFRSEL